MAKIPEETPEEVAEAPRVSLWTRLRPIAYLAAMFVAMNLIFRAFAPKTAEDKSVATAQTEASSEDEYANYYADYGERMTAVAGYESYYNSLLSDLGTMIEYLLYYHSLTPTKTMRRILYILCSILLLTGGLSAQAKKKGADHHKDMRERCVLRSVPS